MNGDHRYYHSPPDNAVAGPSKPPQMPSPSPPHGSLSGAASPTADAGSSSSPPHHLAPLPSMGLFLPPPVPTPPKQHLESTQDLLARFHLHSAYDRYVRPAVLPGNEATASGAGAGSAMTSGDKGKGKEVDMDVDETGVNNGSEVVPGGGEGEEEEGAAGKGGKKRKNTYKHLIKGLPGKHSMRKDDYLTTIMLPPPKQRMRITPFDTRTQEDAFTVSPEGLKGWNPHALVLESAQAREDRKKQKLKRLSEPHRQHHPQEHGAQHPQAAVPLQAPIPTTAQSGSFKPQGTPLRNPSTPRSAAVSGGTPRPGSTIPRPGSTASRASTTAGTPAATPTHSIPTVTKPPVPRPGSSVPRPGSSAPNAFNTSGLPARPASTNLPPVVASGGVSTPHGENPRGQKRQREDGNINHGHMNGSNGVVNGVSNGLGTPGLGLPPKPVLNAKAGSAGVRPRPLKKPRMDGPGQQNGAVQQQPTPQGV